MGLDYQSPCFLIKITKKGGGRGRRCFESVCFRGATVLHVCVCVCVCVCLHSHLHLISHYPRKNRREEKTMYNLFSKSFPPHLRKRRWGARWNFIFLPRIIVTADVVVIIKIVRITFRVRHTCPPACPRKGLHRKFSKS